jgi:hypothetical protein
MSKTIYSYTIYYEKYMATTRGSFEFEEPVFIGDIVATDKGLCNVVQKIIFPIEHSGAAELVVKVLKKEDVEG